MTWAPPEREALDLGFRIIIKADIREKTRENTTDLLSVGKRRFRPLQITKAGGFRRLYSFTGGTDGTAPNGGLVRDPAGNLFGTAQTGGARGQGTVFQLSPAHVLTVLHTFTGNRDGAFPNAGLFRDSAGNLYGTAVKNFLPPLVDGAVFKITP